MSRRQISLFAVLLLLGCNDGFRGTGGAAGTAVGDTAATGSTNEASSSDASASTSSGPHMPRADVVGTLVGRASDGGPLPAREVVIIDALGVVTKTVSGADGTFAAPGVATPYDIGIPYVPTDATAPSYPSYWVGVSRPDPIVRTVDYNQTTTPPTQRTAHISFTATACNGCTISLGTLVSTNQFSGTGVAELYTVPLSWYGDNTVSTPFHFVIRNPAGLFTGFFDIPTQTLADGSHPSLGTLAFSLILENGVLSASVTVPNGYAFDRTSMYFLEADQSSIGNSSSTTPTSSGQFPFLPGIQVLATTQALGPNGGGEFTSGSVQLSAAVNLSASFALPAAPTLLTPASHATGVTDGQSFTWSPYASPTIYVIQAGTANGTDLMVFSESATFDLSRLTQAGMPLAPATSYTWQVDAGGPITQMDDFVTTQTYAPSTTPSYYVQSSYGTFSTQ